MTAEVIDLAVVRGAVARAVPAEVYEATAPMTLDEIDAEVAAIRAELTRPLQRLARLRSAGAHLTAGFGSWHAAVEAWLGDLRDLRLTGSPEAVEERRALVTSLREAGEPTRSIRTRLGVSAGTVDTDLRAVGDPAPEVVEGADGRTRSARTGRTEVVELPAPTGRVYEQAEEWLRRAAAGQLRGVERGLTLVELARVAGWTEGKASGALSYLGPATARHPQRRGTAVRTEELRGGQRVVIPVEPEPAP